MSDENPPLSEAEAALRARQKTSVLLACTLLVLVAVAVLVLPLNKIPFPIRVIMAATDFIVAAVLWLVARQKFSGK
jgi:uncharacterized membrane protein YkvA (DUF1232 family)